jgi:hypothetical protein
MPRHYILVDFENVQPSSLGALKAGDAYIKVFAGQHQTRVDLGLAQALQPFGVHAEYIQITGSGKDALDFHIAFYIGRLAAEHPGATFTIVSRDTGFDPLVKHLAKLGIACKRVATIPGANVAKLPSAKAEPAPAPVVAKAAKPAKATKVAKAAKVAKVAKKATKVAKVAAHPRMAQVLQRLVGMKRARPVTLKSLRSTLKNFSPPFADDELDGIIAALQANGAITVAGTKIAYALPAA